MRPRRAVLAAAALLAAAGGARAQEGGSADGVTGALEVAAEQYRSDVAWLAADARQGRGVGTDGLAAAGEWLEARFREIGLEPAGDGEGYRQVFSFLEAGGPDDPHSTGGRLYAFNVVGRLPAGGRDRLPGVIVIGAHYDHLGYGGQGSLEPDVRAIHNGADDNASGTAALLEAARTLAARRGDLRRDIYFVAFSAEERGVIGSRAFVRSPTGGLAVEDVTAMLNMDMVGRLRDDALQVLGGDSAEEWKDLVGPLCDRYMLKCTIGGDGFGSSDHTSFFAADIPVLHFFTGAHGEYHRPADDAQLINAPGAVRVAWLTADVATILSDRGEPLTLVKNADAPARQQMALRARLGTIPDYAGLPDGSPGLLLSAVRPGSPAEEAGLQRGDVILRIGEKEIRDINDYMAVLQEATPGDSAPVVARREGEEIQLEVTFGAPQ